MTVRGGWNMYPVILDTSIAFGVDVERGAETIL